MRKFLIGAATLIAGAAVAAPASAQYYPVPPAPPAYGSPYGAPYGNAYGYQNNYGQVRVLQSRIRQLQHQINQFDRRNVISDREADRLRRDARNLEHRLVHSARYGLNHRERFEIERGIARLEQRIWREARDGRRDGRRYGYNDQWERGHDRWHDRNDHDRRGHRDHDDDDDDD